MINERILVLAPLWRDAAVIRRILTQAGLDAQPCPDLPSLCTELQRGAGALLLAEEALANNPQPLLHLLAQQPVWSDIPLTLLLAGHEETPRSWVELQSILPGGNVTVLSRPVPTSTLISVLKTALRARRRQYQVREYLREREDRTAELELRVQERTRKLEKTTNELRAARDLFYALFHANPLPVAITSLEDGLFLDVNDAYLRYFGYERHELLGHSGRELKLWWPPQERRRLQAELLQAGGIRNREMRGLLRDGRTTTVLVSIEVVDLDGIPAAISSFVDITERQQAAERIRDLASQLTLAEREERHRISQILHDDLQQLLYSIQLQLNMLREALAEPERVADVDDIERALANAIDTTRNLSVDLSPAILRGEGLAQGISWIAGRMRTQYGLEVNVTSDSPHSFPLADHGPRVLLFQIVRELLFNAVKHAGVSQVQIELQHRDDRYFILVSDEGKGFDPEKVLSSGNSPVGHGLLRSRERLRLLGGQMEIESAAGVGTQIRLSVPVGENNHSTASRSRPPS